MCVGSCFLNHYFSVSVLGDVWRRWSWFVADAVCTLHDLTWTDFSQQGSGQWGVIQHFFRYYFLCLCPFVCLRRYDILVVNDVRNGNNRCNESSPVDKNQLISLQCIRAISLFTVRCSASSMLAGTTVTKWKNLLCSNHTLPKSMGKPEIWPLIIPTVVDAERPLLFLVPKITGNMLSGTLILCTSSSLPLIP